MSNEILWGLTVLIRIHIFTIYKLYIVVVPVLFIFTKTKRDSNADVSVKYQLPHSFTLSFMQSGEQ